jgi:putative transcriptional regulator
MESGAWWALDASEDDIFNEEPGQLWKSVLRRQGGLLALASAFPSDPSLN